MFGTSVNSHTCYRGRIPRIKTTVDRASRRLLGLIPEFSPLPGSLPVTRHDQDIADSGSAQMTLLTPRSPVKFYGNACEKRRLLRVLRERSRV